MVRRPGTFGYWVGGAVMGLSVVGAVALFVVLLVDFGGRIDDFVRVDPQTTETVELEAGPATVYVEDGPVGPPPVIIGPDGERLELDRYGSDVDYDVGGRSGRAGWSVRIATSGPHEVENRSVAVVAIGEGLGSLVVWMVLGPLAAGAAGFLVGFGIVFLTWWRRYRAEPEPVAGARVP